MKRRAKKVMEARKTLITGFLCMLMIIALTEYAQAKISAQPCSNCHTMHGSQNGTWMRLNNFPPTMSGQGDCEDCHAETRAVLLRLDCIGCHAQDPNAASNISGPSNDWPQIAHSDSQDLAAGNYRYVFANDKNGHNVHGFGSLIGVDTSQQWAIIGTPPGWDPNYDPSSQKYGSGNSQDQVMCAGQFGCHGNRETSVPSLSIRGTHHADDSMLKFGSINEGLQGGGTTGADYLTAGKSYRFLYNVLGGEDSDWQDTVSSTDHNEYKGQVFGSRLLSTGQSWGNVDTISELCAECHGYYHASDEITSGSGSPWLRHPTDVVLPSSGEYASITSVYSIEAPIARQSIPNSVSSSVTLDSDIVMCLSCHRAHASPYYDALRWNYETMTAGGGGSGGCFTCHTQKN